VLELDLQGDPLSCSDRKYTQVLQAKIEGFTYTDFLTNCNRIHIRLEDVFGTGLTAALQQLCQSGGLRCRLSPKK
jgi:hypothetical protein